MNSLDSDLIRSIQGEFAQLRLPLRELDIGPDRLLIDLVAGDLVMVCVFFAGLDGEIALEERNAINDMRRAIAPLAPLAMNFKDVDDLYHKFVRHYPGRVLSADCLPYTVRYLQGYDETHGTSYAQRASALFAKVAEAVVNVDGHSDVYETITLANFRELLQPEACDEGGD